MRQAPLDRGWGQEPLQGWAMMCVQPLYEQVSSSVVVLSDHVKIAG